MTIASGQIVLEKALSKAKQKQLQEQQTQQSSFASRIPECHLCMQFISDERARMGCINKSCKLNCHMICLANYLLSEEQQTGHYIPISGVCPICLTQTTWIELLQNKDKFNSAGLEISSDEEEEEEDDELDMNNCEAFNDKLENNNPMENEIYELSD